MSDKEKAAKWRQYSRSFVSRGWTKLFDPSKHWGVNELVEQEKELKTDERAESLDQHKCCGGHPCLAAQRRTEDEFRKEMSALSEADTDLKNQNRQLAQTYKLPLSLVENLRDVFSKFDEDHDGTVSGKEILDVFQTLGAIFTRQQCDDVIKSFLGGNISGEINFEEMIKMFAHRKSNPKDYQQDLELAFKMFDLDGDGYVCAEDLKQVMKMLGNDLSDEEIRTIYSHLDTDDNGLIDFSEFESILYPDVRAAPIVKKKRKRTPQRKAPVHKPTAQKKPASKLNILGAPIRNAQSGGGGIYNAFYGESTERNWNAKNEQKGAQILFPSAALSRGGGSRQAIILDAQNKSQNSIGVHKVKSKPRSKPRSNPLSKQRD